MRSLLLLFFAASAASAGPLSVGVKAGVPLTDFFTAVNSPNFGFNSSTNRYIVGGTVELHLPAGFGVELDALYRHLNYNTSSSLVDVLSNAQTTGNAWEFPLLLKYRFPTPVIKPFVDAGVAFDTLSGMKETITNTLFPNRTSTTTTSSPQALQNTTTTGFVIGAGVDIHVILHISPEVRYTRWSSQHFTDVVNNVFQSNQNQAEFLLGITF